MNDIKEFVVSEKSETFQSPDCNCLFINIIVKKDVHEENVREILKTRLEAQKDAQVCVHIAIYELEEDGSIIKIYYFMSSPKEDTRIEPGAYCNTGTKGHSWFALDNVFIRNIGKYSIEDARRAIDNFIDLDKICEIWGREQGIINEELKYYYYKNNIDGSTELSDEEAKALFEAAKTIWSETQNVDIYVRPIEKKKNNNYDLSDFYEHKDLSDEIKEKYKDKQKGTTSTNVLGKYIRHKENEKPKVMLYINNIRKQTDVAKCIATTFVHEMMHAGFDCEHAVPNNSVAYIEESLAEYASLCHLKNNLNGYLDYYKEEVKNKQKWPGLAHYGFGLSLYEKWGAEAMEGWKSKYKGVKYSLKEDNIKETPYYKRSLKGLYLEKDIEKMIESLETFLCLILE